MIDLTDGQKKVITQDGLCILSACPGSGKTSVVAYRLNRLVNNKELASYQGVAVLSFTNVAKDSVLKGYKEITNKHISPPHFVGTIDSFLNNFIFKPFSHKIIGDGTKEIKILDTASTWLNDIYPKLKQYRLDGQNITYDKNGQVIYTTSVLFNLEQKNYIKYVKKDMLQKGIIVQNDLSYFCLKVLRDYPNVAKAIINRYPFIMIDEAQDCSDLQMAIIDFLVESGHKEVMLIGDPYQAIYEWRDANPKLFIEKEQDNNWQICHLLETQRCGPEICSFLNLFHVDRKVSHNPKLIDLIDAEVKIVYSGDLNNLIKQYLLRVEVKNIKINTDNVAILYGGHKSKINFRKTTVEPISFWKTQEKGFKNINKVYVLLLLAKIAMFQRDYKKAYGYIEKFFYFLIEQKPLISKENISEHKLGNIASRIILWDLCKKLPSLEKELNDWIIEINILVKKVARELGIINPIEIKKKRDQQNINLKDALLKTTDDKFIFENITLDNIHQIKSRTFDAVMVYVDSGTGNYKISINKLKRIIEQKDLIKGDYHEDGRCFYVAVSRARRLLWVVSTDKKILNLFESSNGFKDKLYFFK